MVVCHNALPPLLSGSVLAAEHRALLVLIYSAELLTAVETASKKMDEFSLEV